MTVRLAQIAKRSWWEFDGFAVSQNMPPLGELSMDRFCSFVLWLCLRNADEPGRIKFNAQLYRPPPGQQPKGPWTPAAEMKSFTALKAALGK